MGYFTQNVDKLARASILNSRCFMKFMFLGPFL